VGFNPFRPHAKTNFDIVFAIATLVVVILVIAWVIFG